MTSANRLRSLLSRLGLSQRAAAEFLRDAGIHATDRQVRYWASGQEDVPEAVWLVLESALARVVTR